MFVGPFCGAKTPTTNEETVGQNDPNEQQKRQRSPSKWSIRNRGSKATSNEPAQAVRYLREQAEKDAQQKNHQRK